MACNCITPAQHADLNPIIVQAVPITFTGLNNVSDSSGILTRSGGTPGTSDAYAYSNQYVEGTGCAYWECRQFFNDADGNDLIYMVIEDEYGTANRFGWYFQNGIADFRRSNYHGAIADFPIYYGPAGGPAPPDQVGYNVGVRFGLYYNNGNIRFYTNVQFTNDTETFTPNCDYEYAGLPTDRRWRLKVYVFPSAPAHSPAIVEVIKPPDSPSCSSSASPSASVSASPSVTPSASPSASLPPCTPPEGVALSCVNARGRLFVTLQNVDNTQVAYAWHEGATRMPISSMTNWKRSMRALTLQELGLAFETDNADANMPMIVSVHRNLRKNYVRDARVNAGSNRIDSATAGFDSGNVGDMIAVFGHNIGGPGINHILGRIAGTASPSASPSPSSSLSASPSTTESPSPSATPSASPSSSRSASPSPSHSPSASPSASPSHSLSTSSSPSGSPSASVSKSPSASPSAS